MKPDIVAEIIERETKGIAGSTEVRAGMEIVKLRARVDALEAEIADGIAARRLEQEIIRAEREADRQDAKWREIYGR